MVEYLPNVEAVKGQRLREFIKSLEERILRTRLDGRGLADLLRQDASLTRFLNEELGVVAGLFGIADQRNDRYVTLQASRFQNNTDFEAVEIPRVPAFDTTGAEVGPDLLDFLFMVYRRDRQLSHGPPEFLTSAIRAIEARKGNDLPSPRAFPSRDAEVSLNKHDSNILLYVEAAEILLFLYAWRWFLRHAQTFGLRSPVAPEAKLNISIDKRELNYWREEFWSKSGFTEEEKQGFPELELIRALKGYEQELVKLKNTGAAEGSRAKFLANSLQWWPRIASSIDAPAEVENVGFSHDWYLLGLLDENKSGTQILSAMLEFVCNEVKRLRIESDETTEILATLVRPVVGVPYSGLVDSGIESALRRAILSLLSYTGPENFGTGTIPIWKLLAQLHKTARFLLIPYFYQFALIRIPLDHVVLGVWNSFDHQLTWEEGGQKKQIPQVVHAIIGIRANFYLSEPTLAQGKLLERIMPIHSFLGRMAQPLVDRGFYGKLIGRAQKEKGAIETGRAFGHQIKPIANMLTTEWVPAATELFDVRVDSDSVHMPDKVGSLILKSEFAWLKESLGVAPFLNLVSHAGDMMKLWAMTQTHADLPVASNAQTVKLEEFLNGCLQYARNSLIPYAVVNKRVKDNLLSFRTLIENFTDLLKKQKLLIKKPADLSAIGIQANNAGDTVWLSRIFTIIFQGCIEYGSLLRAVEVSILQLDGDNKFKFVVTNTRRPVSRDEIRNELIQAYEKELKEQSISEKQISDLIVCLNDMREGAKVITDRKTHSEGVLTYCLDRISGSLENWPGWSKDQSDPSAVTEFICQYNLKPVEGRKK